jgi:hypothetical protein
MNSESRLRTAIERFLVSLPAPHRELFVQMAHERRVPPYRVVARALEREIVAWLEEKK